MSSVILDRYNGVVADQAIKIPVKAASTGVLTLSGLQSVDGISLVENDRMLYTHGASDNGIYVVSSGTWNRSTDFDGTFDIVKGTLIYVAGGTVNGGSLFNVTSSDPITIGTTTLTFSSSLFNPSPPSASESTEGIAELATQTETNTGTDDARIVTPLKLATNIAIAVPPATEATAGRAEIATQAETNAGTDDARIVTPLKMVTYTNTILPTASETVAGKAEIATQAETNAGTDDSRIVSPLKLATFVNATVPAATETTAGKAEIATQTETNAGTNDARIITPLKLASDPVFDAYGISNGILVWSTSANALTVALKTEDGGIPSSNDPIKVRFREATLSDGSYVIRSVTSALSLTVSSGSTLGCTSGVSSRIRGVLIDNAGSVKIGVYNPVSGTNILGLDEGLLYTTVAEGGAGAADSAQVLYSDAVYSSKAILEAGYVESDQTTAGTWAQALDKSVSVGHGRYRRTGDIVQIQSTFTGAVASGVTTTPSDDTIPAITEGNEYMSRTITPTSKANLILVESQVHIEHTAPTAFTVALHKNSDTPAVAVTGNRLIVYAEIADSVSTQTYRIRAGNSGAGTMTFNGSAGTRLYGGVYNSFLIAKEIFV